MYVVFLAGGVASGKSTVARELERLGAARIDLDALSREVLTPQSACLKEVVRVFGGDLLLPDGTLDRTLLAARAFASGEAVHRLEVIELPYIKRLLDGRLQELRAAGARVCVVEVPLLDRMEDQLDRADEVLCVVSPPGVRLAHALDRGMAEEDFLARRAHQPSDAYLRGHATSIIENAGSLDSLLRQVQLWWDTHVGR